MIVSVAGECSEHSYDSVPFLIPEMDCVRIVSSSDGHELLRKVPNCVKNIFKIYSQKPSAYLFYAFEKYEVSFYFSRCNLNLFSMILFCNFYHLKLFRQKVINRMNI